MPQYVDGNQFQVSNGPSKYDLMLALFDGSSAAGRQREVTFHADGLGDVDVIINEVGRESGSGEDWLFKGYIVNADDSLPGRVEGYFSTKTRRGNLRLTN